MGWLYANGGLLCAGLVAVVAEGPRGGGGMRGWSSRGFVGWWRELHRSRVSRYLSLHRE